MFLNISRILASNVLKMFSNIIVSIGCAVVVFSIRTNQPEAQIRFILPWPARNIITNKNI